MDLVDVEHYLKKTVMLNYISVYCFHIINYIFVPLCVEAPWHVYSACTKSLAWGVLSFTYLGLGWTMAIL